MHTIILVFDLMIEEKNKNIFFFGGRVGSLLRGGNLGGKHFFLQLSHQMQEKMCTFADYFVANVFHLLQFPKIFARNIISLYAFIVSSH